MTATVPQWETDLWHFISNSKGDVCPMYLRCERRLTGARCYCPIHGDSPAKTKGGSWSLSDGAEPILEAAMECCTGCGFFDCQDQRPGSRIFQLVEKLAEDYLAKSRVSSPPVPASLIEQIGGSRNVEVRELPLMNYHGAIWRLRNKWVIHLNKNDSPQIRRLTLFHEVFHLLAHTKASPVFKRDDSREGSFNELLAEVFACYILMPRELVEREWSRVGDLRTMAKLFDMPEKAIAMRLRSLRLMA